jgi:hypothetical protein
MAIGLLGASLTSGATVYTVPAGISHAVVHITLVGSSTSAVLVNNISVLNGPSGTFFVPVSVSMMLSPGDIVRLGVGLGSCTVSGYEVA